MEPRNFIPSAVVLLIGFAGCQTIEQQASEETQHIGLRHVFDRADSNKDGKLSNHEIAIHHHREELELYDLNNDNHISKSEWDRAHPTKASDHEHFNNLDKDDDGLVDTDEAILFVTEHVSFGDMMASFDENGDQHLHWSEVDEAAPNEVRITLFSLHPGVST